MSQMFPGGRWIILLLAMAAIIRADDVAAPATQPAPAASSPTAGATDELLTPRQGVPGYGAETYRIVNERDEIVTVLRNGMTVICKRVPSPAIAVRGYALTGGVYEGKWLGGGLSHLLEHLVAGGSNQRRTEAQNKEMLQKIGNDSNAYTTEDHTCFFINTTTPHLDEAVDLVTGWMLGALITKEEYRREYEVVQRELERNTSNPDVMYWQLIQSNRYKVSPARIPVIGFQEVIQGLSRDDVFGYYQLAYQPNNLVFAVTGDVDPEQLLLTVRKYVADAKPGRVFSHDIEAEPPVLAPRTVVATFPKLGQARLDLAFPSVRQTDNDMYALDLLATILGSGESSILVQELRDNQQLCTGVGCGDYTPAYVEGSFQVDLYLDPDKLAAATDAIFQQIEKIKKEGVDEGRLARAKAQMKVSRLKGMQTSQDVAASLATDFFSTGDAHFSDRYVDRIGAVTAEQVRDVARRYLDRGRLLTTALVPREAVGAGGLPRAEDLLRSPTGAATQPSLATTQPAAPITRVVLDNGLVLLHRRITTTPLVQISLFSLGGLSAEDEKTNGIGNMTMALLPRGTTSRSAQQIAEYFFDATGGDLTTACGNNTWFWTCSCTRDDLDRTLEVYSDVVNHPAMAENQVADMKRRILAAIESQDAAWDQQAFHFFKHQFFGPMHSPYQFQVIGTKENIARFTTADLRQWYESKVKKAPHVMAIFGDIDTEQAAAAARKYFGAGAEYPAPPENKPAGPVHPSPPPGGDAKPDAPSIDVTRVEIQKTDQTVAGVVVGFESNSVISEDQRYALTLGQCLTGGFSYPTGYIFEILRGRGLVYEAATMNQEGRSSELPGAFIAYAGCDPAKVNEVLSVILENIARLQGTDADIQPDWFERSKTLITTSDALQNETPAAQAMQASLDEMYGLGYKDHQRFAEHINSVKLAEVRQVANTRLRRCVITVCTPSPGSVLIKPGVREYASFPPVDLTPRGVQHDVNGVK